MTPAIAGANHHTMVQAGKHIATVAAEITATVATNTAAANAPSTRSLSIAVISCCGRRHDFERHGLGVLHVHLVARCEFANEGAAIGCLDRERAHQSILTTERDSVVRSVDGLDPDGRRDRLAGPARQMLTFG